MSDSDSSPFNSSLAHNPADPFRLLVEAVVDYALFILDPAGKVVSWNPGAERIYGYSAEEIIGRDFSVFFIQEDIAAGNPDQQLQCVRDAGSCDGEFLRVRRDGSIFWAEVTISNLKDHLGRHAGFAKVTRDITEQKESELAFLSEATRHRLLFEKAGDGIIVLDAEACVIEANPAFADMLGLPLEQTLGLHPWDWDVIYSTPEKLYAEWPNIPKTAKTFASVLCHSSGRLIDVEISSNPTEYMGRCLLMCIFHDVTERKRAEKATQRERDLSDALLNGLPGIFYLYDENGHFLRWNRQFETVSEYTAEEIKRLHPLDFFDGEEKAQLAQRIQNVFQAGEDAIAAHFVTKSGRRIPYYFTGVRMEYDGQTCLLGVGIDLTAQTQAQDALRAADLRLQQAVVAGNIGLWDWDLTTNHVYYSREWKRQLGYEEEEFGTDFDEWTRRLHPADQEAARQKLSAFVADRASRYEAEFRLQHRDGSYRWILSQAALLLAEDGRPLRMLGSHVDLTEKRLLETQLRQAQKMDAVGKLAGGIAHDFNNLLTVVNGYSTILMEDLPTTDPRRDLVTQIFKAGERAGLLTRQLLAFSRQQLLEPKILDLNAIIGDIEKMVRRLIGEDLILTISLSPKLGSVRADVGQIEQILINLVVNARDAMPQGGHLTVETSLVNFDDTYCRTFTDLSPGDYIMLAVSDTGVGMDAATQERLFEPFFTTKAVGKGTGLGLATVQGIIKQLRGHVSVYSEVGHGTTFKVYFPCTDDAPSQKNLIINPQAMPKGNETILLVEDEVALRVLAARILKACGYTVLEAGDGRAATAHARAHPDRIDLLISDVVLPYLGGRELAEKILAIKPGCRVLFISGYTDDAVLRHGVLAAEFAFLQKPFTPPTLAQKVRAILDTPR